MPDKYRPAFFVSALIAFALSFFLFPVFEIGLWPKLVICLIDATLAITAVLLVWRARNRDG
jgi:hypothetical protein